MRKDFLRVLFAPLLFEAGFLISASPFDNDHPVGGKMEENANTTKLEKQKRPIFTTKRLALAAMFVAISYGLSFLELPIFPAAPYLKLDFSFSIQLIGGFMLGPVLGEMIVIIVQLLRLITSSTGGVGELANLVAATCFIFVPSLIYHFKQGLPIVFITLCIGSILQIGASLLSNRFMVFPLYMGDGAKEAFDAAFWIIVAFNAIKCAANALITLLLYKRLKKLLHIFL